MYDDPCSRWNDISWALTIPRRGVRTRGLSLLEILVVITIITGLTVAIAVNVFGAAKEAKHKTVALELAKIAGEAQRWTDEATNQGCPTLQRLVTEKRLPTQQTTADPWGTAYVITCPADEPVVVTSAGPDRKPGTEDDVVSNAPTPTKK